MKQKKAAALVAEWQTRLSLNHWTIKTQVVRLKNFNENKAGNILWQLRCLTATITLLDPRDYPDGPHLEDFEDTIVHELLHLWIAPFHPEENSLAEVMMEQAVNKIAGAFVTLKRERSAK